MVSICSLVVWLTSMLLLYYCYQKEKSFDIMEAMMVTMGASMISSLLIGTIVGLHSNGKMLIPTILATLIGLGVSFLFGRKHSLALLDGVMAAVMSGMMGAMLGVMMASEGVLQTLVLLNSLYWIVWFLLLYIVRKTVFIHRKHLTAALSVAMLLMGSMAYPILFPNASNAEKPAPIVDPNSQQEVMIQVTANGYIPNRVQLQKGVPTTIYFLRDKEVGCLSTVVIKDFEIVQELHEGMNKVIFTPTQEGSITFACGMNMYHGTLQIK
ncbi:cupredoxin domain-containing protein [Risungbinella massiliensis]|uniref:cupredoxin domain-containing protein n=1 Tax=Risungbinella massiliensis TaxID=1329796 RepID=UPI00069B60B6|nr:cupredoxin domain-containing protein [Risungbinella massiliensis]